MDLGDGGVRAVRERERHVLGDDADEAADAVAEGVRDALVAGDVVVLPLRRLGDGLEHLLLGVVAEAEGEDLGAPPAHRACDRLGDRRRLLDAAVGRAVGEEQDGARRARGTAWR